MEEEIIPARVGGEVRAVVDDKVGEICKYINPKNPRTGFLGFIFA
jgi:hypothetical protein